MVGISTARCMTPDNHEDLSCHPNGSCMHLGRPQGDDAMAKASERGPCLVMYGSRRSAPSVVTSVDLDKHFAFVSVHSLSNQSMSTTIASLALMRPCHAECTRPSMKKTPVCHTSPNHFNAF